MKTIIKTILTFIFADKCDICGKKTLRLYVSFENLNNNTPLRVLG